MNIVNSNEMPALSLAGTGMIISSAAMVAVMATSLPGSNAFAWFSVSVIALATLAIVATNISRTLKQRELNDRVTTNLENMHAL